MNTKLAAIAFATVLAASTASALEVRDTQTAPNVFGSTTTYDHPTTRPAAVSQRQAYRRALNVRIRTVQRQYLNGRRAGDPRAAQWKVELDRLKAEKRTLNRSIRAR